MCDTERGRGRESVFKCISVCETEREREMREESVCDRESQSVRECEYGNKRHEAFVL